MLSEHERNYGLGMDALVTVYALGTRTKLCFRHGCSGHRMLLEHERNYDLGMDPLVTVYARGTRTKVWFGHGCSGHRICSWNPNEIMIWAWMLCQRMLLEPERNYYGLGMDALVTYMLLGHERNYGLGMDALVTYMLLEHEQNYDLGMDALSVYALGTRTKLWFGHGCSGHRICSWNTNEIML